MLGIVYIFGLLFFVSSTFFLLVSLDWVIAVIGLSKTTDVNATLLGGLATLLSISAALFAAVIGLQNQRAVARRVNTIDFINSTEKDAEFNAALQTFVSEVKNKTLVKNGDPENEGSEKALHVRLVLNHFEIAALGIDNGVYDDAVYQKWYRSSTVLYWDYAKEFVNEIRARSKYKNSFTNFEKLAERYRRVDKQKDSPVQRLLNNHWS